jgi:aflatoxin B1 aldehyde reductase
MHKEGLFKKLGLSNLAALEVAEITGLCRENGWVYPSLYQGKYNALRKCSILCFQPLVPCGFQK